MRMLSGTNTTPTSHRHQADISGAQTRPNIYIPTKIVLKLDPNPDTMRKPRTLGFASNTRIDIEMISILEKSPIDGAKRNVYLTYHTTSGKFNLGALEKGIAAWMKFGDILLQTCNRAIPFSSDLVHNFVFVIFFVFFLSIP